MQRDSIGNTFIVAILLCLVCSLLVSATAVVLKPLQDKNVAIDRQRNILVAAGMSPEALKTDADVEAAFSTSVTDMIVDLKTGEDVTDSYDDVGKYDQIKAAASKKDDVATQLERSADIAKIKWRELHSHIYIYTDSRGEKKYIFPVRGLGLWSTLKGFVAMESDLETIAGLTFYEHKETPGLGGEVDSPRFKGAWPGKKLYDQNGEIAVSVTDKSAQPENKVDSISGATITSRGVQNLLRYWLGPEGFEPFLIKERAKSGASENATNQIQESGDING